MSPKRSIFGLHFDRAPILVLGLLLFVQTLGCGASQDDLFLKAAQRQRGGGKSTASDTETANETAVSPKFASDDPGVPDIPPIGEAATITRVNVDATPTSLKVTDTAAVNDGGTIEEARALTSILERRPKQPLDLDSRRRRTFENMVKINEALLTYVYEKGHFPKAAVTNSGGVPLLSWRVAILPYLGYQELYDKFQLDRPWNVPPNKGLLEYIPDEYVSPERFDTKTNYLVPAGSRFLFGVKNTIRPGLVDDGIDNTIMLVEAGETRKAYWTEPKDLTPTRIEGVRKFIGQPRADGIFAVWASGVPTLLDPSVSDSDLYSIMTYAGNDLLKASAIHRAIPIKEVELDPVMQSELASGDGQAGDDENPEGKRLPPQMVEDLLSREPEPSPTQLSKAKEKLRRIFQDDFDAAKTATDRGALATKLIAKAAEMEKDPEGAHVLQSAALRLAVDAGDASALVQAIDARVARFDVNAYKTNADWIQAFGQATASQNKASVRGDELVRRAIPVIFAGIRQNEFIQASVVARIAARYTSMARDELVPRLLSRLRSQLGAAKREFDKTKESLETFRIDPDDARSGAKVGTFFCFVKGDWEAGLKLIADAGGTDLSEVARMDLRGASSTEDRVAIGDAWWELSRRGSGIYRQGAQDRAVMWYAEAMDSLPDSLDRLHVQSRLQEADGLDGTSPIALCMQLAEELNIDMSASLTSMAGGVARGNGKNRDDD